MVPRLKKSKKTRKRFLYDAFSRQKTMSIFNDENSSNTIPIYYTTIHDVKNTIDRLEHLYKTRKYSHKRISQVGMIMKVRLELMKKKKPNEFALAKQYFDFLKKRTTFANIGRYKLTFKNSKRSYYHSKN